MNTPHRYRIAAFGRKNSGKTVQLTCLEITRAGSSDGSTLRFAHALDPIGFDRQYVDDDSYVQISDAELSKNLFWSSVDRLQAGKFPRNNDAVNGFHRYLFSFGSPPVEDATTVASQKLNPAHVLSGGNATRSRTEHRAEIELVDYAGEFSNPKVGGVGSLDQNADENVAATRMKERAEQLRKMLIDFDGLIVFAEAPPENDVALAAKISAELTELQATLSHVITDDKSGLLRFGHVALVITKWDRSLGYEFTSTNSPFLDEILEILEHGHIAEARRNEIAVQLETQNWLLQAEATRAAWAGLDLTDTISVRAFREQLRAEFWMHHSQDAIAHRNFFQQILNHVGTGSDGTPNVGMFPVSAFGMNYPERLKNWQDSKDDAGEEDTDPQVMPQPPFDSLNVVEPFHFVLDRVDQRATDRISAQARAQQKWWSSFVIWRPIQTTRPRVLWKSVFSQVGHDEWRRRALSSARQVVLKSGFIRSAGLVATCFVSMSAAMTHLDANLRQDIAKCDAAPECFYPLAERAESYLAGDLSPLRLLSPLVLGRKQELQALISKHRDRASAEELRLLSTDPNQEVTWRYAQSYLDRHVTGGEHIERAVHIQHYATVFQAHQDWLGVTGDARTQFTALATESSACPTMDTGQINTLVNTLQEAHVADFGSINGIDRKFWQEFEQQVESARHLIPHAQRCAFEQKSQEAGQEMERHLSNNDLGSAIDTITGLIDEALADESYFKLADVYVGRLLQAIRSQAAASFKPTGDDTSSDREWERAIRDLGELRSKLNRSLAAQERYAAGTLETVRDLEEDVRSFQRQWSCYAYSNIHEAFEDVTILSSRNELARIKTLVGNYVRYDHVDHASDVGDVSRFLERLSEPVTLVIEPLELYADFVNGPDKTLTANMQRKSSRGLNVDWDIEVVKHDANYFDLSGEKIEIRDVMLDNSSEIDFAIKDGSWNWEAKSSASFKSITSSTNRTTINSTKKSYSGKLIWNARIEGISKPVISKPSGCQAL